MINPDIILLGLTSVVSFHGALFVTNATAKYYFILILILLVMVLL